jgi:RNA polymerase sigma-70 factor, ECF subfamily
LGQEVIEIQNKLVKRAKEGNQQAMHRLYKLHVQAMYNICNRMVANTSEAEDILQEAFISAFSKLDSFREESSFGAWLKRIVINKSLNYLRKQKWNFEDIEETIIYEEDEEDIPEISPEKIHFSIQKLPEKARIVINLYLLEGYKHKEIAEMLDISESTSKSQYSRAKQLLKSELEKVLAYEN